MGTLARVNFEPDAKTVSFPFRPWVRRAGLSIIFVAAGVTVATWLAIIFHASSRFGWAREPFVWIYLGTLWLGGVKVFLGTARPIAEVGGEAVVLRPLHQFRRSVVRWSDLLGTEQMMGGDRLIVYYKSPRGMRYVALNLNLVKGRREFLDLLDTRMRALGFTERVVERSRYLSRPA
jgi:hypothetical protein